MTRATFHRRGVYGALAAVLAIVPAFATASDAADPCAGRTTRTRVFAVRFKPVAEAAQLIDGLLSPCGAYRVPKTGRLVTVEDDAARLEQISDALASWDVPPPTVEITVSLILASRQPEERQPREPKDSPDARRRPPIGGEIRGLSDTLAKVTRWTHFEKIGSFTLKAIEGHAGEADLGNGYGVAFTVSAVDASNRIVQLDPFVLRKYRQASDPSADVSPRPILTWAQNVPEGQVHLVGAPGREKDRALFLALEAWIDDKPHATVPSTPGN